MEESGSRKLGLNLRYNEKMSRKTYRWLICQCALFFSWHFLLAAGPDKTASFRLFYSANREGEVEPCHCQGEQLGGLARVQTFLQTEKKSAPDQVFWGDAGDMFFLLPTLPVGEEDSSRLRAETIARALGKMGLEAMEPGERDFAAGLPFLMKLQKLSGVNFISANLTNDQGHLLFEPFHLFTKRTVKLAVFGVVEESQFQKVPGVKVLPARPALEKALSEVQAQKPDLVVVLSHLGLDKDRELAQQLAGVDVIVGSHSSDILDQPVQVKEVSIVQAQSQGRQMGILDLKLPGKQRIAHRLINLGESFDAKNAITDLMKTYRESLRQLAKRGTAEKKEPAGKSWVAHPENCRTCHRAQYDFWAGTKHAAAYLTLYAKNQHFDPACISCHSLGFKRPGGFLRITAPLELKGETGDGDFPVEHLMKTIFAGEPEGKPLNSRSDPARFAKLHVRFLSEMSQLEKTPGINHNFLGVQCEHCHGSRIGHPGNAKAEISRVNLDTCRTCHRAPNAPEFDPKWKVRVACPLMKH